MPQAFGYKSYFGVGEESVWGTLVSRAYFGEFVEDTLKTTQERIQSEAFRGRHQKNRIYGKLVSEGGIGVEYNFADRAVNLLLKCGLGAVSTQADTPVVGVHRHTFTMTDAPHTGLSLEIHRDASSSFTYGGFRINETTFSLEPNSYLRATFTGAAKSETLTSPSVPTFAVAKPAHHAQAAITWGGVAKQVKSFEFTINQSLDLDRRVLGSRHIIEPVASGKSEVSGSFEMFFESLDEYNDFLAGTERALVLSLTGDIITGSTPYKLTFTFAGAELEGETPSVDSAGHLSIPLSFRAYETASAKPVSIVLDSDLAEI